MITSVARIVEVGYRLQPIAVAYATIERLH